MSQGELEPINETVINRLFKKQSGNDTYYFRRVIDSDGGKHAKVECNNEWASIRTLMLWHVYDPEDMFHDDGLPKLHALKDPL